MKSTTPVTWNGGVSGCVSRVKVRSESGTASSVNVERLGWISAVALPLSLADAPSGNPLSVTSSRTSYQVFGDGSPSSAVSNDPPQMPSSGPRNGWVWSL